MSETPKTLGATSSPEELAEALHESHGLGPENHDHGDALNEAVQNLQQANGLLDTIRATGQDVPTEVSELVVLANDHATCRLDDPGAFHDAVVADEVAIEATLQGDDPEGMSAAVVAEQPTDPLQVAVDQVSLVREQVKIESPGASHHEQSRGPERHHSTKELQVIKLAYEKAKKNTVDADTLWTEAFTQGLCMDTTTLPFPPEVYNKFELPMVPGAGYISMNNSDLQSLLASGVVRETPRSPDGKHVIISVDKEGYHLPIGGDREFIVELSAPPAKGKLAELSGVTAIYARDKEGNYTNILEQQVSQDVADVYDHDADTYRRQGYRQPSPITREQYKSGMEAWLRDYDADPIPYVTKLMRLDEAGNVPIDADVLEDMVGLILKRDPELLVVEGMDHLMSRIARSPRDPTEAAESIEDSNIHEIRMKAFEYAIQVTGDPLDWRRRRRAGEQLPECAEAFLDAPVGIVELCWHQYLDEHRQDLNRTSESADEVSSWRRESQRQYQDRLGKLLEYAMDVEGNDPDVLKRKSMLEQYRFGDFRRYGMERKHQLNDVGISSIARYLDVVTSVQSAGLVQLNEKLGMINFQRYRPDQLYRMLTLLDDGPIQEFEGASYQELSEIGEISVFISGKTGDHNGAFSSLLSHAASEGSLAFEVETEEDISRVVWLLRKKQAKIHRLTIAGHGSTGGIHLSNSYIFRNDLNMSYGKSLQERMSRSTAGSPLNDLIEDMVPDAEGRRIVNLDACSQGVRKGNNATMPERLSEIHSGSDVEVHGAAGVAYMTPEGGRSVGVGVRSTGPIESFVGLFEGYSKRLDKRINGFLWKRRKSSDTVVVGKHGVQSEPSGNRMEIVA